MRWYVLFLVNVFLLLLIASILPTVNAVNAKCWQVNYQYDPDLEWLCSYFPSDPSCTTGWWVSSENECPAQPSPEPGTYRCYYDFNVIADFVVERDPDTGAVLSTNRVCLCTGWKYNECLAVDNWLDSQSVAAGICNQNGGCGVGGRYAWCCSGSQQIQGTSYASCSGKVICNGPGNACSGSSTPTL